MFSDNKKVLEFINWQEGYENEVYSRNILSHGIRLQIHRSLLEKICKDFDVKLCQISEETRQFSGDKYKKLPDESKSKSTIYIKYF